MSMMEVMATKMFGAEGQPEAQLSFCPGMSDLWAFSRHVGIFRTCGHFPWALEAARCRGEAAHIVSL